MLSGLVVAHWSQDGQLQKDRVNSQPENVFPYHAEPDLIKAIVSVFSYDCDTVIIANYTKSHSAKVCILVPAKS